MHIKVSSLQVFVISGEYQLSETLTEVELVKNTSTKQSGFRGHK